MKKAGQTYALWTLIVVFVLGAACIAITSRSFARIGIPELYLRLSRQENGAVPLALYNIGDSEQTLDVLGMEYFLFHPANGKDRYIVYARSRPFGISEAENQRRVMAFQRLRPRESLVIGDMRPLLAQVPEKNSIVASFSSGVTTHNAKGAWTGVIKSIPFIYTQ